MASKLTEEQVIYIYTNPDALTERELATIFKVNPGNINRIRTGKYWSKVTSVLIKGESPIRHVPSDCLVLEIPGRTLSKSAKPILYKITDSECWEVVNFSFNNKGYPRKKREDAPETVSLHRYVFTHLKNDGVYPGQGVVIRHTCDNSKCVNPSHLIPGTYKDNACDMVERKRSCDHKCWVLDSESVKVLVNDPLFKSGDVEGCVNKFGVSRQTLSQIKCGQRWGHITGIPLRDKSLPIIARPKLNIDQVKAIFLTSKEIPAWKLVEKYGVSKTAVNDIRYGRSWTHITIPLMLGEYS